MQELRDWAEAMRGRTCRQLELQGSTPAGWHVLLPDGDFGFLDVKIPATAEEHALLVQQARDYMRQMQARACLWVQERELRDGRPALLLQLEAMDRHGRRERRVSLHRIAGGPDGRRVDALQELQPAHPADIEMARAGLFPDLLPDPPSPLRIL
jgi:hypothetical protein